MSNKIGFSRIAFFQIFLTLVIFFTSIFFTSIPLHAVVTARSIANEKRIKVINYIPNSVIRYVGHYTYQSTIEFEEDEMIEKILMGTSGGWQIQPEKNRIFLKPINEDTDTNMTVMTNKRIYFFEMHGEYAKDINDDALSFIVKFIYQDKSNNKNLIFGEGESGGLTLPDLTKPEKYNFKYKISGKSKNMEPILIFDDGQFTYVKFKDMNSELPAVFLVNIIDKSESLVNYRITNKYLVIERVSEIFTFRHGADRMIVFNEGFRE